MWLLQGRQKRSGRSGFGQTTFITQAKKKFLIGFNQCFMAWQRKSSKYSDNVATPYSALATTNAPWYRSQAWRVLHCSAGRRSRQGRGSVHAHNTCSITTCSCKFQKCVGYCKQFKNDTTSLFPRPFRLQ